ncbi:MAG TPA: energy-coupling factor ABC transporter permease [Intrasporangiaceae bacterium]|nr:energy-coupling factor ABC transporter permease [Intrasporangiaceae bacterium]
MHVPDGFLDAPTSVATAAVAVVAVAGALRGARRELDDRTAPLAGLVAVFVFAAQMINFPVGAGTSGHLMGGVLAAVLVGPWTATLALTVVLLVQALFFADGGLTALGTNVTLIAVVAVWVGYGVFRLIQWLRPTSRAIIPVAAGIAALVSVPVAALVFAGLWAVGGAAPIDLGLLTTTMVGWHTVIGVGEALITAVAVSAILAARPDIVYAARHLRAQPSLTVRSGVEVTS